MAIRRRITALTIALAIAASTPLANVAFGADEVVDDGRSTPVTANIQAASFRVTVPTQLPVHVDERMGVTVATDAAILNNSAGPVVVSNVTITPINSWQPVAFDLDASTFKIGQKKFGFELNECKTDASGQFIFNAVKFGTIAANSSLPLTYDAKVSGQKQQVTQEAMANIVFTMDWDNAVLSSSEIEEVDPSVYWFTPGDTKLIEFKFKDAASPNVTFSSSNEAVATVELPKARLSSGTKQASVRAISIGSAIITGTLDDGTSSSIVVTVVENEIDRIEINTEAVNKHYIVGQSFDSTGLVVTAHYKNGSYSSVQDYDIDSPTNMQLGRTGVTITFMGTSAEIPITVIDKSLTSIAVTTPPTKTAYIEGNNFDAAGMIVTATYNNGTTAVVTPTLSRNTNLAVGQTTIDISFGGKAVTQSITVAAKSLSSIAVTTPPTKTAYIEGNNFDASGMLVTATYNNGTSTTITGYTLSNNTSLAVGQTAVDINYGGKHTTIPITVAALTTGTRYTEGDYEYSYNQLVDYTGDFATSEAQQGWGVKLLDKTKSVYESPLTEIHGKPVVSYRYLFSESTATTLDLSSFNTSKVTDMAGMFNGSAATTLDLSSFNTSNVTNMGNMFSQSQATTIEGLNKFDTSSVISMVSMFHGSEATTLDLSSFRTLNVVNMSQMFNGSEAKELDIRHFNTSNVINMYYMFGSSAATTLDLSSFDTSRVYDMRGMFYLSQATTIDVSSFDTSRVENMYYMFSGSKATTLELSRFNTSNVTDMREMFSNSQATTLDLRSFSTSNVTSMYGMFLNSAANTLNLSSFDTSKVTTMGDMFNGSQATSLNLRNFNTRRVSAMAQMFSNSQATTLDLSSFDTSNVTNMHRMFSFSPATTLDLSSFDTFYVTNIYNIFYGSQATTGYARTKYDADKLNASINKSPELNFVVK